MVRLLRFAQALGYLTPLLFLVLDQSQAQAEFTIFGRAFCCPKTYFHPPRVPKIRFLWICPPVTCDPSELEHYGVYPSCWRPFPYPADHSHCPCPQGCVLPPSMLAPGSVLPQGPAPEPGPDRQVDEPLPPPTRLPPREEMEPPGVGKGR